MCVCVYYVMLSYIVTMFVFVARLWKNATYKLSLGGQNRGNGFGEDTPASFHPLRSGPTQRNRQRISSMPRLLRQFQARAEGANGTAGQGTCRQENTGEQLCAERYIA